MDWNKFNYFVSLFVIILCIFGIVYSLHNVDLSWNARHIELVDCNGLVCASVIDMYNDSMLRMVFLMPVTLSVCIYNGYLLSSIIRK